MLSSDIAQNITPLLSAQEKYLLEGAPEGLDAKILAELAQASFSGNKPHLHIASDSSRMDILADCIQFFGANIEIVLFPAWDCLPYDRVSPSSDILAKRIACLHKLNHQTKLNRPQIILTSVNAVLQKLPPKSHFENAAMTLKTGALINDKSLIQFLSHNGYVRTDQVMEAGEFAVRGGLMDIFPPANENPVRLDFFGDEIESLKHFDPLSQRSLEPIESLNILPVNEFLLNDTSIERFRLAYRAQFGTVLGQDALYSAVSEGRHFQGMEHWLPLFHDEMSDIFNYIPDATITMDFHAKQLFHDRHTTIQDYYQARRDIPQSTTSSSTPYKPLPPNLLYLGEAEWNKHATFPIHSLNPFHEGAYEHPEINFVGKKGRDFAIERQAQDINIYEALKHFIKTCQKAQKTVVFVCYTEGSRARMQGLFSEHKIGKLTPINNLSEAEEKAINLAILGLEHGFENEDLVFITETDLLGDRLVRKSKRARKADNFIAEATSLQTGDIVVHITHGIGRFEGLKTLSVTGAPHDCLMLTYAGGDRLYLPVENIEMLSRFGSEGAEVALDRLGGAQWQVRHAKLKKRLKDMADELIRIAANRALAKAPCIEALDGLYQEFCARFPYPETEDQQRAIDDVVADLGKGQAMDRLVCGDVGFGKTEVALRSAFLAALSGLQVVVVVPTTLLCRQHSQTFIERFRGLPIKIKQLSRLITAKEAKEVKEGLASGQVDIVIGTHALLSKDISFKNIGLVVIDEEQHFGVAHKERLKSLKSGVHVLTLTATPIPRTLQLAMSGVRELSLITTPPVDRLAVRTFITPFDEVVIREALLREHFRGGQSFFVCPRISDLDEISKMLTATVPELKFITAHGRMTPTQIEDTMNAFYDGQYDILLATTIIESGLDIPRVNTMIVHRADMFGLAQLYQLRGRVGRSKLRAFAYLTIPPSHSITETATRRLQVLHSLDTLGAGFSLASHDMDIRGTGNLLGEEQSGHIREVGLELYQQMLEEAVANAKGKGADHDNETHNWSPQINVGVSVLIPETYVKDLNLRMGLYRRLGEIRNHEDVEAFAAELIDRFGPLPQEVKQLLQIIKIKNLCFRAGIERIEAGKKGAIISFHNNNFTNPFGLVEYINRYKGKAKLRPDHKLVHMGGWDSPQARLDVCMGFAGALALVAEAVAS